MSTVKAKPGRVQYVSLLVLALQSAGLTVLMKYSRNQEGPQYYASSVVCVVETVKLFTSFTLEAITNHHGNFRRALMAIINDTFSAPGDFFKLSVPAGLYAIQNNLCYLALQHLSALNYQVIYQMKILTTAGFSVWLLGKQLNFEHWISLILLMTGVIFVQLSQSGTSSEKESSWFGFVILVLTSISSGYAGVYFEQLTKAAAGNLSLAATARKRSLWMQSVQLGLFGLVFSLLLAFIGNDRSGLLKDGFFYGYRWSTFWTVMLQSLGGVLVAIVIRYADNIQKAFATSLSIVLCSLVSVGLLGHSFSLGLFFGTALVIIAVVLYARANRLP